MASATVDTSTTGGPMPTTAAQPVGVAVGVGSAGSAAGHAVGPRSRTTALSTARLRTEPRRTAAPRGPAAVGDAASIATSTAADSTAPAASDPARPPVGDPAVALHAARALEIARRTRLVRAAKIRKLRRCRCGRFQRCRCDELDEKELDAVLPDDGARYAFALETAQAGKALDGETVARVRDLIAAGVSRREVGRRLGIDRYAVRVIARAGESGMPSMNDDLTENRS